MVKKRSVKKTVRKTQSSQKTWLGQVLGPTLPKIGLTLALTAASMLYNGSGMNYYIDSVMRGFPLAILTLEGGVTHQIILVSILVDLIFWYLVISLIYGAYTLLMRR